MVATLVLAPLAAYAIACGTLYFAQRSLLYYPTARHNTSLPVEALATSDGAVQVSVQAHAGAKAVLYFGGNAEDVSQTVPELAAVFHGHAVYALHYRGYGGSAGTPNEADNIADAIVLFDRVRAAHPDVVVIGRSLGSGVAVQVAGARPARRLVLVTPFDAMPEVAATHYPMFPVRWLVRDRYESVGIAPRLVVPTTLIAADRDRTIPMVHAERLHAAFRPGVATLVVLRGHDHESFGGTAAYFAALRGTP